MSNPKASNETSGSLRMVSLASTLMTTPPPSLSQVPRFSATSPTGDQVPSQEEIDQKPWKYLGYKHYSEFVASDDEFYILRRFRTLNTRVALMLQDQICDLEEQLDKIDEAYSRKGADDVNNGTFRNDREDRREILEDICDKLMKYNKFMMQQSELRKYSEAPMSNVENIRRWHENYDDVAINEDEHRYLDHGRDLVCLVPKDKAPLRKLIDRSRRLRTLSIWEDKKASGLPISEEETIIHLSDKRIDSFIEYMTVTLGLSMLLAPIWILDALSNPKFKLAVITGFVIFFVRIVSYITALKPYETLAATAAYSAVLVTFLQFGSPAS